MNRNTFRGPRLGAYGFFPKKIVPRGTSIWFFCRVVREKHATCSRLLSRARAARKIRQKSRSPAAVTRSGTGSHGSPAAGREARAGKRGPGTRKWHMLCQLENPSQIVMTSATGPGPTGDGSRAGRRGPRATGGGTFRWGQGPRDAGRVLPSSAVATRETFGSGRPFCNGHKKARHWAGLGGAGAG